MKLYAVVIGRPGRNTRYVVYCPFIDDNRTLAVYETMKRARKAKKLTLEDCEHKSVYVIRFTAGEYRGIEVIPIAP